MSTIWAQPGRSEMAYIRPQVTVDQNMTIAPTSIERDQPAFIFGPNYELHRYSNDAEKAGTSVGTYDGTKTPATMVVGYPKVIDPKMVDVGYTKLTGDNVVAKLADLTPGETHASLPEKNADPALRAKKGGYSKLLFDDKVYLDENSESSSVQLDSGILRNLKEGDKLLITYTDVDSNTPVSFISKIEEVEYKPGPFDIGSSDSAPEGGDGTLVTIEDAIPENADTESVKAVLVDVFQNVGFDSKDYQNPGEYQWEQSGERGNGSFVDADGNKVYGIRVNSLSVLVPRADGYFSDDTFCEVLFADLFVTYRELNVAYSDTLHSLVGASEVANMLGTVDPDNPLAMGVYMAALNSATDDGDEAPPVFYMSVPSDDADGYAAVLNAASLTDKAYVFAPTTRDDNVIKMVQEHVISMSAKTVKMWRIAAASAEIPQEVSRLDSLMDVQNDEFVAIPVSDKGIGVDDGPFDMIRVVKGLDSANGSTDTAFKSTLVVGDKVRFGYYTDAWGDEHYDTYTVAQVINNYTVRVETDAAKGGSEIDTEHLKKEGGRFVPAKVEIYHTYTAAETADVIASISRHMASRRMLNVFPSVFEADGFEMTGEFAACAVAGLVSATEPQQPITNVTVRGIDNIPLVYQTFNKTQLDTIAAGGTFIVAQDLPDDRVYVRHQITTAYPDGNLNTAELSITKNVDSISYAFAELFRPYYGKYNITPGLVAILTNLAGQLISQLAGIDSVYGPQLIAEETEILYVRRNALMKDHLDMGIRLGVPYPCNNIDIVLTV